MAPGFPQPEMPQYLFDDFIILDKPDDFHRPLTLRAHQEDVICSSSNYSTCILSFLDTNFLVSIKHPMNIDLIPAGEKHWHGATEDSEFSHIYFFKKGCKLTQLEV